jgi:hypothetical protein
MIVNVKNGNNVISVDFRLRQVRYQEVKKGKLSFLEQSHDTMDALQYLYNENKEVFLKCLAEDIGDQLRKEINPTKLEILTAEQYMEMLK